MKSLARRDGIACSIEQKRSSAEETPSLKRHLEKVYDKYRRQLFACALSVTRCRDLAEDAIHEAFCRLLQQEVVPHNLKAYVFSSVHNCAIDLVRQMNRTTELVDDYIIDPSDNQRETAGKKQFHQLEPIRKLERPSDVARASCP